MAARTSRDPVFVGPAAAVRRTRGAEALRQTFKSSQRRAIRAKIHSPIADNNPIAANTNQIFHGA
jgi:hypothetical protein